MSMSADLAWMLLRKHNCYQVKRAGKVFTNEPNNLTNLSSYKYSGLANRKSVGVSADKDGSAVLSLKSKKAKNRRKPANAHNQVVLKRDFRRVSRAIAKETSGYRPDLTRAALARWTKLYQSHRIAAGTRKRRAHRGKKSRCCIFLNIAN